MNAKEAGDLFNTAKRFVVKKVALYLADGDIELHVWPELISSKPQVFHNKKDFLAFCKRKNIPLRERYIKHKIFDNP